MLVSACYLCQPRAESVVEIRRLKKDEQVEIPGPTKIRHENRITRERREEGHPRSIFKSRSDVCRLGLAK